MFTSAVQAAKVVDETTSVTGFYVMPVDDTVTITIKGADGGKGTVGTGGSGATVTAQYTLTAGQTIGYIVGAAGGSGDSGGGGGSTGVYIDGTLVMVAGAGAGGDDVSKAGGGGVASENALDPTSGNAAGGKDGYGGGAGVNILTPVGDGGSGGGGVFSDGISSLSSFGGEKSNDTAFASGGDSDSSGGGAGGQGLSGGGGAIKSAPAGGGGYSGGAGATTGGGDATGGGSYFNDGIAGYVSGTKVDGVAGGAEDIPSNGSILIDSVPWPIAEYHMDECLWNGTPEEIKDSVGSFDAKVDIVDTTNTTANGYINRAGEFKKVNDDNIVAVAVPPAVLNGKNTFTFTTWLYLKDPVTDGRRNTFLSAEKTDDKDEDDILFRMWKGDILLRYQGGPYEDFTTLDSTKLFGGKWVFLALTVENRDALVYNNFCVMINGGVDETEYQCKLGNKGTLDIAHLVLAQDRAGHKATNYFPDSQLNGNMDEVKFYDTYLTQEELQAIYINEKNRFYHDGSTPVPVQCPDDVDAMAEYRFDECYWLNGAGGITGQVRDNSANGYDATEVGTAQTDSTDKIIGSSADMGIDNYLTMFNSFSLPATGWSLSIWMKFPLPAHSTIYYTLGSYLVGKDLPIFWLKGGDLQWGINTADNWMLADLPDDLNGWHHFLISDDGERSWMYIDGVYASSIPLSTSGDLEVLLTSTADYTGRTIGTKVDEYKLWNKVLGAGDAKTIYEYEKIGMNYDGTERNATVCGASTSVDGWQLVGIPAEARDGKATISFADVFEEFNAASYKNGGASDGWIVYKPVYDPAVNKTGYGIVELDDNVTFGTGYWLLTKSAVGWETDGLVNVDYDVSQDTIPECAANRCVDIDVESAVADDSNGPNRYTMFGFVGKEPIQWGDCKIIVDGTIMTIEEAEGADILSREVWYWATGTGSGSTGEVRGADDISCTDNAIGGCTLIPHQGYWISTLPGSIGKQIQILLPKGVDR